MFKRDSHKSNKKSVCCIIANITFYKDAAVLRHSANDRYS